MSKDSFRTKHSGYQQQPDGNIIKAARYSDIVVHSMEPLHLVMVDPSRCLSDLHIEFPEGVSLNLEVAEALAATGTPADVLKGALRGDYEVSQIKMYDRYGEEQYRWWEGDKP